MSDDGLKIENLEITLFDVGSTYWVRVTHVNQPDDFFIRPLDYDDIMEALERPGKEIEVKEVRERYEAQEMVIYKSDVLKRFIRGRLTSTRETKCNVFAPDYGFIELSVPYTDVHMPYHDTDLPPLATHSKLAGCKPVNDQLGWTKDSIDAMRYYIGKEKAKMIVRDTTANQIVVELVNSGPDDIATIMAFTGYSKFCSNINTRVGPPQNILKYKQLLQNEVLYVTVLSGKSLDHFFVATLEDYKAYTEEKNEYKQTCRYQSPLNIEDLVAGKEVVIYNVDESFERAIIKEIMPNNLTAKVQLIDRGTILILPFTRLRYMPRSMYNLAAIAIYCSANEQQVKDSGLPSHVLSPGFSFFLCVKQLGERLDTPHHVDLIPERSAPLLSEN